MLAGTHKILSLCLSLSLQVQLSHPPHPISFWADLTANHPSSEYSPPPPPVTATDHMNNSHPVAASHMLLQRQTTSRTHILWQLKTNPSRCSNMYVTHIKWYTGHIPHPVSDTQGHPSTWNSVITTVYVSQALASSGEEVNTEQTTYSKNKKHRTNYLLKKEHSVTKSTQNKLPTPHRTNSLLKKITQSQSQHRTNSLLKKIPQLLKPTTPVRSTATFRAIPPQKIF